MTLILRGCSARHWHRGTTTLKLYNIRSYASPAAASKLDLLAIDRKWQARWAESTKDPSARRKPDKGKFYVLPMFPYPSGILHLGHLRVYTISDVVARAKHMQGHQVIHPMGWDAFGLPAENAAIERGVDPAAWTVDNISKMKEQLKRMGGMWDWSRELVTSDACFYKHTQRIFLMLYERGLAYQAESLVNYDPIDRTVLANEQVDANGFSWRSGAKVERIQLKQWFMRITEFKEALLKDLDKLAIDNCWPERVLSMQKNWLGRSTGAKIRFDVHDSRFPSKNFLPLEVFTTRPDTLFGVQYLALSIEHPLVKEHAISSPGLQDFLKSAPSLPLESKAGYLLDHISATNPVASIEPGTISKTLPIYVAPYVLADYGEGAVMGVPGHDTRDHAFWREHRGQDSIPLVVSSSETGFPNRCFLIPGEDDVPFTKEGFLTSLCGQFKAQPSAAAGLQVVNLLKENGNYAEYSEFWRIRDWLVSRQRCWGAPIPIIHCQDCGVVPVPVDQLPVVLPPTDLGWLKGKGGNPLDDARDWVNTKCPSCGGDAKRETDTMDTFVDSSWYFMRFIDPDNSEAPISAEAADLNLPVDIYVGGIEHAILHLLYARFISKFLATTPCWPSGGGPNNKGEPFKHLITQGMVHGKTYIHPPTGRFLEPEEIDLTDPSKPRVKLTGELVNVSYEKMSKSKYNGVDPTACISKYGADATRAHMLFQAPVSEVLEWDEQPIVGIQRWFSRVWRVVNEAQTVDTTRFKPPSITDFLQSEAELWSEVQQTIINATKILNKSFSLNTLISDLIKLTNTLYSTHIFSSSISSSPSEDTRTVAPALYHEATSTLLRLMAPVTPAFAEECWELLHSNSHNPKTDTDTTRTMPTSFSSIFNAPFPIASTNPSPHSHLTQQTIAVLFNDKIRFVLKAPRPPAHLLSNDNKANDNKEIEEYMLEVIGKSEEYRKWRERGDNAKRELKRVVVARGARTVNLVFHAI
ncbi:MAG: Leucyl-tRNA synthetase, mitochondrial [Candelina submexicana]|nr:MAG: Leucyl-tRNA synthetase, mitochondrial [Candelina submexicana]